MVNLSTATFAGRRKTKPAKLIKVAIARFQDLKRCCDFKYFCLNDYEVNWRDSATDEWVVFT